MKLEKIVFTLLVIFLALGIATHSGHAALNVADFELEIDLKNGNKYDVEYEARDNQIEAKYQVPGESVLYGQQARPKAESFIGQLALTPTMNQQQVVDKVLAYFRINQEDIDKFDLDVEFDK